MQKVYLLLRNNQQTGPFALDELLQFNLKPFDLIWIEGKSAGWYYPQEIEALRPHLPFLKKATAQPTETAVKNAVAGSQAPAPKKIFVSMPSTSVVKDAPQQTFPKPLPMVEKEAPAFTQAAVQPEAAELKTTYAKPLEEVETAYMNWAYQQKAKKKPVFSKSGLIVLCLVAVALFATWRLANKPASYTADEPQQPATAAQPVAIKSEAGTAEPSPQNAVVPSAKKARAAKLFSNAKNTSPVVFKPVKKASTDLVVNAPAKETEDINPPPPLAKDATPAVDKKSEPVAAEAPKEKKKLRDKLFDIFHKKREENTEETKPADTDNGSRQSSRREAGSSLTQMVTVKFDIPNSWMMGIKGAKATLTNKSSETVAKAIIEVRYYNDDNDLLDKKTVAFSNVKSKQSQTISIPEHATATRLDYSVVSAVGAGEPVAFLR